MDGNDITLDDVLEGIVAKAKPVPHFSLLDLVSGTAEYTGDLQFQYDPDYVSEDSGDIGKFFITTTADDGSIIRSDIGVNFDGDSFQQHQLIFESDDRFSILTLFSSEFSIDDAATPPAPELKTFEITESGQAVAIGATKLKGAENLEITDSQSIAGVYFLENDKLLIETELNTPSAGRGPEVTVTKFVNLVPVSAQQTEFSAELDVSDDDAPDTIAVATVSDGSTVVGTSISGSVTTTQISASGSVVAGTTLPSNPINAPVVESISEISTGTVEVQVSTNDSDEVETFQVALAEEDTPAVDPLAEFDTVTTTDATPEETAEPEADAEGDTTPNVTDAAMEAVDPIEVDLPDLEQDVTTPPAAPVVDEMQGTDGDDMLIGDGGDNVIFAAGGNDSIDGLSGDDELHGGDGDDLIMGAEGDDLIIGDLGNDTLVGGAGGDTLIGGEGSDTYVFEATDGEDTVSGFVAGTDKIDLVAVRGAANLTETDMGKTLEVTDENDVVTQVFLSQEESAVRIQYGETVIRLEDTELDDIDDTAFVL